MGFGDRAEISQQERGISTADRRSQHGLCSCGSFGATAVRGQGCITIYDTPIGHPDLATYSQTSALADHVIPTWNNHYITTHDWPSYKFRRKADVKVYNVSGTTAALNGLVHFYTSPFGIGTLRQLRLTQAVNLAPRSDVTLSFPLPGDVFADGSAMGIHVRIEHPFDINPLNDAGAKIVQAVDTGGGRRRFAVQIPVVNESAAPLEIRLSLLPTTLTATLSPLVHGFAPFEQILAELQVEVPSSLAGTPLDPRPEEVTVVARAAETGELIGGATLLVRIVD